MKTTLVFQPKFSVARKNSEYNTVIEHPDYTKYSYCRRCQRNRPKELKICIQCNNGLSHSARNKSRYPHVYKVHRY